MRYWTAKWSARTRGVRWRTVTGEVIVSASGASTAAARAIVLAEKDAGKRLAAFTLHLEEGGDRRDVVSKS
jgi:hypothetical protein